VADEDGVVFTVASTDNVVVTVHDLGGVGPTVLYSHATGLLGRMWKPVAGTLADRYHGVALDYRAHGDSTPPADDRFDWHGFRDDLLAVVDSLETQPLRGVGHSMGGATLLTAELARPGTFRSLVLFEPIVFPPNAFVPAPRNGMADGARRRRPEFANRADARANFAAKPPLNELTPEALDLYVTYGFEDTDRGTVRLKCEPEHEALTFENFMSPDLFPRLGEVRCPVLVMAGGDGAPPAELAPTLADELAAGEFLRAPSMGHFGPMEDPVTVADAIAAFFATH
jgi:pimeloyl-ACP methyl ester carboxylesterase